jgi:hypothetical protein
MFPIETGPTSLRERNFVSAEHPILQGMSLARFSSSCTLTSRTAVVRLTCCQTVNAVPNVAYGVQAWSMHTRFSPTAGPSSPRVHKKEQTLLQEMYLALGDLMMRGSKWCGTWTANSKSSTMALIHPRQQIQLCVMIGLSSSCVISTLVHHR